MLNLTYKISRLFKFKNVRNFSYVIDFDDTSDLNNFLKKGYIN